MGEPGPRSIGDRDGRTGPQGPPRGADRVPHPRSCSTTSPAAPADSTDLPYVEPEDYGLRVNWQSEAVRIEAAEFLVATRVQESSRRRLARVMDRMRDQRRADRKT